MRVSKARATSTHARGDRRDYTQGCMRWRGAQVRRVCLAFESVEVGQHMLAWATKYCLFPDDEVYIVHCFSKVGWRGESRMLQTR